MRLASHSPRGEAGRPITNPKHFGLCCEPGRLGFDTPAEELRVIDLVAQKNVAAEAEQPQHLPTLERGVMAEGTALAQEVEYQLGIPPVILLAAAGAAANLGRVADQDLMVEPLRQLDEPGAVAAGLQRDDYVARELSVEAANVITVVA